MIFMRHINQTVYRNKMIFALFASLIIVCEGKLAIYDVNQKMTYDIRIHNGFPWKSSKSNGIFPTNHSLPIVRIDKPLGEYDPCTDSSFIPSNIEPFLPASVKKTSGGNFIIDENNSWIAMIESDRTIPSSCRGTIPLHLLYVTYAALYTQKLGASGLIYLSSRTRNGQGSGGTAIKKNVVPPHVDVENKLVLNSAVTIPLLLAETFQNIGGEVIDISSLDKHELIVVSNGSSGGTYDLNPYGFLFERFSFYRCGTLAISATSFILGIFIAKYLIKVVAFYKQRKDDVSQAVFKMRLLILLPELLNAFLRSFSLYDPFGFFFITDYFFGRIIVNLVNSLSLFTDVTSILFCYDVYRLFKGSRALRKEEPFIMRHKWGLLFVLGLIFFIMIMDIFVLYLGLVGNLGGNLLLLPTLYVLLVSLTFIVASLKITSMMQREVKETIKNLPPYLKQPRIQMITPYNTDDSSAVKVEGEPNIKKSDISNAITITTISNKGLATNYSKSNSNNTFMKTNKKIAVEVELVSKDAASGVTSKVSNNLNLNGSTMNHTANLEMLNKMKKVQKIRRFLQLSAIGRLFVVLSLLSIGTSWIYNSPIHWILTFLVMYSASLMSSIFQILAAYQLPTNSLRKVVSSS